MGGRQAREGRIFTGTSGWNYPHWKGKFYPEGTPDARLLEAYSETFSTVEVNNSFYGLPEKKTFRKWADTVQQGFVFSVKANRFITHMKKLKCGRRPLNRFFGHTECLGDKLGPVLFQLPPRWKKNTERLEDFLSMLPGGTRYTFEFRDRSWLSADVYGALSEKNAALCVYDLDGKLSPVEVTADFVYIRLHGPAGPYEGSYSEKELSRWAGDIRKWTAKGLDVYCYFDNDQNAYAPKDAMRLREMTGK